MSRILVVDDEPKLGTLIAEMLQQEGHEVARAQGGRSALVELSAQPFDLVVTDLRMPEVDGLAVLRDARSRGSDVILMTAYGTAESAVEAMKAGAADYLLKPFAMDELRLRVGRLADQRASEQKSQRLVEKLIPPLVAQSPKMRAAIEAAQKVAASDASVMLLGESGTGKSQLARFIHFTSKRAGKPLVEVHCAALPETLLEAELFGHEKGAFTGANEKRTGHLARADGGTLFLDEIGEVTQATQVKLLRFLQEREFVSLGSTTPRKVDVRVIAATNRDLGAAVKEGAFREDFFYRLNVFAIELPPLRDRPEDLLPLAEKFLESKGVPGSRLSAEAHEQLRRRTWPGNVRELENALERALILAGESQVRAEHLLAPGDMRGPDAGEVLREGFNLDEFERDLIHAALLRAGGNKTAAAKMLGITRRRLYSRLESLGEPATDS
ncbi:MAG TPA: sigma-54 dependent transcriptional regulator [Myxococcales bacterium]|nr:sigma-54 dependent transcriptional regulator [Myxococcales bacterium]